jgi:hypothetical protein
MPADRIFFSSHFLVTPQESGAKKKSKKSAKGPCKLCYMATARKQQKHFSTSNPWAGNQRPPRLPSRTCRIDTSFFVVTKEHKQESN